MINELVARRIPNPISKIATIVGVVLLFAGGAYVLLIRGCWMCANEILHEYPSPNGRTKLVVFQRDCGATTGYSTQASLLPAYAHLQNRSGDVLVIDTDGAVPSGDGGGPALGVSWISDAELLLTYCEGARVFRAETRHKGIDIRHQRSCPSAD